MPHSASKQFIVKHVGTERMGTHHCEQAVAALAALITVWQHSQDEPGVDSAEPLPLPGSASDTDRAA
jgi:hypothetical protein